MLRLWSWRQWMRGVVSTLLLSKYSLLSTTWQLAIGNNLATQLWVILKIAPKYLAGEASSRTLKSASLIKPAQQPSHTHQPINHERQRPHHSQCWDIGARYVCVEHPVGMGHVASLFKASPEPGSGHVEVNKVEGEMTKTGAPKETFGEGRAAQSEAGKKGGAISASRSEEERKESARKAARTRAERYGDKLDVSAPENDELMDMASGEKGASG